MCVCVAEEELNDRGRMRARKWAAVAAAATVASANALCIMVVKMVEGGGKMDSLEEEKKNLVLFPL